MKIDLIRHIVCPNCGEGLAFEKFSEEAGEIKEGMLISDCGESFPIIGFIPRMLAGELREALWRDFPEFFAKYGALLPVREKAVIGSAEAASKMRTAESFGYEWTKFSRMVGDWKKNFDWYFESAGGGGELKDKIILEVGCGKGRHTFYAAKSAREVFAIDLSRAVDVARVNNEENGNIHFIQADIFNLPFRPGFFDFVFSLGVLHHLPDPEKGFRRILDFLKPGAGMLVYVYHKLPADSFNYYFLKAVNAFRRLTVKLPHPALYALCWPIALASYVLIILPYGFLRRFKATQSLAGHFPLKLYADYPFQVILNDTFDRFSAPVENRYSEGEIKGWYERAGLQNIKILGGGGWRIFGIKSN